MLISEFMEGISIEDLAKNGSQEIRDFMGYLLLKNTFEELFLMNFM